MSEQMPNFEPQKEEPEKKESEIKKRIAEIQKEIEELEREIRKHTAGTLEVNVEKPEEVDFEFPDKKPLSRSDELKTDHFPENISSTKIEQPKDPIQKLIEKLEQLKKELKQLQEEQEK